MRIRRRGECESELPRMDHIRPGVAFEHEDKVFIKLIDGWEWNAVDLRDGSLARLGDSRRVKPINAEVVVK